MCCYMAMTLAFLAQLLDQLKDLLVRAMASVPSYGLIIKKKWLDLILSGEKTIELRSRDTTKRGPVALIESGSGLIRGEVTLFNTYKLPQGMLSVYQYCHRVEDLSEIKYPVVWAWCVRSPVRYAEPIPYTHPRGAVVWVSLHSSSRAERGLKRPAATQAPTRGLKRPAATQAPLLLR